LATRVGGKEGQVEKGLGGFRNWHVNPLIYVHRDRDMLEEQFGISSVVYHIWPTNCTFLPIRPERSLPLKLPKHFRPHRPVCSSTVFLTVHFLSATAMPSPIQQWQIATAAAGSTMASAAGLLAKPLKPGGNNSRENELRDQSINIASYC